MNDGEFHPCTVCAHMQLPLAIHEIMIYVSGSFQMDKSHFDAVASFIQGRLHCCPTLCFVCALMLILRFCPSPQRSLFRNQAEQLLPVLSICTTAWRASFETDMLQLSRCARVRYISPHNKKKAAQIYVGGRSSSLTIMLVEVVCSPF